MADLLELMLLGEAREVEVFAPIVSLHDLDSMLLFVHPQPFVTGGQEELWFCSESQSCMRS
eukprot:6482276-Amphidinium_carterae.1